MRLTQAQDRFYEEFVSWYHKKYHFRAKQHIVVGATGGRSHVNEMWVRGMYSTPFTLSRRDATLSYHIGDCPTGVDKFCREFADSKNKIWDYQCHEAYWREQGLAAGPNRNKRMIDAMTAETYKLPNSNPILFAFDGGRGTKNCVENALAHNAHVCCQLGGGKPNVIDIFYPDGKPDWVDAYYEKCIENF
jgi:hypothetical protein